MRRIRAIGIRHIWLILLQVITNTIGAISNASGVECANRLPNKLDGIWEDRDSIPNASRLDNAEKAYRLASTGNVLETISSSNAASCLKDYGGRVIFAGDSYMRNLYIAFLDVLEGNFSSHYMGHLKRVIKYKSEDLQHFYTLPQIPQSMYTHAVGTRSENLEIRTILPDGGSDGSFIRHLDEFLAPAVFESDIYVIGSLVHDIARGGGGINSRIEAYVAAVHQFFERMQSISLQNGIPGPLVIWVNAPYFGRSPSLLESTNTSAEENICPACDIATKRTMNEIVEIERDRENVRILDWWSMSKACKPTCLVDSHHIRRLFGSSRKFEEATASIVYSTRRCTGRFECSGSLNFRHVWTGS